MLTELQKLKLHYSKTNKQKLKTTHSEKGSNKNTDKPCTWPGSVILHHVSPREGGTVPAARRRLPTAAAALLWRQKDAEGAQRDPCSLPCIRALRQEGFLLCSPHLHILCSVELSEYLKCWFRHTSNCISSKPAKGSSWTVLFRAHQQQHN